jgi:hydroxyquinol 1,2-dioxygenase
MRNLNELTITAAILERISHAKSARVRQISESLVRHLHAFIREVKPSFEEWEAGIEFLTRTGQMCDDKRQEFVLLSDALGASMLIDAISHPSSTEETESTVLGPFYVKGAPQYPAGADISEGIKGDSMLVTGVISTAEGAPIDGASINVWHSDGNGFYDVQLLELENRLTMRARLHSDAQGRFHFLTIRPAAYPIPHDGPVGEMLEAQGRHPWRPAHVHFMIEKPGFRKLVTHLFIDGDKYLDSDVVFGVKEELIVGLKYYDGQPPISDIDPGKPHLHLQYDFRLKTLGEN